MEILKNENIALNNLKLKINSWRMHKKTRGERMPEDLWQESIELAREHGASIVAKRVRIDSARLRREVPPRSTAKKLAVVNPSTLRMAEVKLSKEPMNYGLQKRMFEVETGELKITFFH